MAGERTNDTRRVGEPALRILEPLAQVGLTDDVVRSLLDAAPDAVVVVDEAGVMVLANRQAEHLFGFDHEELIGMPVDVLLPDDVRADHRRHRSQYRQQPRTRPMGEGLELRARRADGQLVPVEIALSPLHTPGGVLTIAVVRDVTERKRIEARSRRILQALEATHDGLYLFDEEALRILHVNQGAVVQSGHSRDDLLSMTLLDLMPDFAAPDIRTMLRDVAPGSPSDQLTTRLCAATGSDIPVEVILARVIADDESDRWFAAAVRDITRRVAAEEELREAEQHLALTDDRDRIARDLHDRVIQKLFATGIALEGILQEIGQERARERVDRAVSDLDDVIRDIRAVIFELGGERASGAGVRTQVGALVNESTRSLGFSPQVRFHGPVDTAVPAAVTTHLLAGLREALSNVARHARATAAEVTVEAANRTIMLRVRDNGIGLPTDSGSGGHGLGNLTHRATQLGGTFEIGSGPDGGTELRWSVPLDDAS